MNSRILLKIQNGTTKGGGNLCRTCRNAHVIRGVNNQQIVRCSAGVDVVTLRFEVAECNRYHSAGEPSLYEMEEIAWRLITKKGGRAYGFVDADEFKKRESRNSPPSGPFI